MPKFSIIIPAHDEAEGIEACLDSILRQTMGDIEAIIVDDASTDGTLAIAQEAASKDDRLKVLHLAERVGGMLACKRGVEEARAPRIMFACPQDRLPKDACGQLYQELQEAPVDILHFGSELAYVGADSDEAAHACESLIKPYAGKLNDAEILRACIVEPQYHWELFDKVFESHICRKGFSLLPDTPVRSSGDFCAYVHIAYFARSYRGVPGTICYQYSFTGSRDSTQLLSLDEFANLCSSRIAADVVGAFFRSQNAPEEYLRVLADIKASFANACTHTMRFGISANDRPGALEILARSWGDIDAIAALAHEYWFCPGDLAKVIATSSFLHGGDHPALAARQGMPEQPVKSVGAFYFAAEGGGLENVLKMLAALWASMGYQVTLFLDAKPAPGTDIPQGIGIVVLPAVKDSSRDNYRKRMLVLREAAEAHGIDVMVYHAWLGKTLLWDLLAMKSMGIRFVIHCHGMISYYVNPLGRRFGQSPYVCALSDGMVVLNSADELFWRDFSPRVYLAENPLPFDPDAADCSPLDQKRVLWVGRLSWEKHPKDALRIFSRVHQACPDARFTMIGSAKNEADASRIAALATKLGLDGIVDMPGWVSDRDTMFRHYQSASVLLMTSEQEGYSLTLAEGKAMGLPCVMYDLPYLTMARGYAGIAAVPCGAIAEAANEVARILNDDALRKSMGAQARDSIAAFRRFDFEGFWSGIFSNLQDAPPAPAEGAGAQEGGIGHGSSKDRTGRALMWQVLLGQYDIGVQKRDAEKREAARLAKGFERDRAGFVRSSKKLENENARLRQGNEELASENSKLRRENEKLKAKAAKYRNSNSWKAGRVITWLPRKMKKLFKR